MFAKKYLVNSVLRHSSRLGHDLSTSVNDSDFARDFIFTKNAKFLENKTLTKISEITVLIQHLLQIRNFLENFIIAKGVIIIFAMLKIRD